MLKKALQELQRFFLSITIKSPLHVQRAFLMLNFYAEFSAEGGSGLEQRNIGFAAGLAQIIGPERSLNFADVGFS